MMELIYPLSKMLKNRELSAVELCESYIKKIEAENKKLNAYTSYTFEKARKNAAFADSVLRTGKGGVLCGIPLALKDNICTQGDLTTCASKALEGYRPCYSAAVWERLEGEGAVLLGKTNMDEFAMGSTGETGIYPPAKNPNDITRIAGGSSSGSAAAVSAGLSVYSLGSDTGGSVRQPAAMCGAVGLKPTYGAVSRYGLIAHASSLDTIGVIASSVRDAALVFDSISGRDLRDMTSCDVNYNTASELGKADVKNMTIGFSEQFINGAEKTVIDSVKAALSFFEKSGAEIIEIKMPDLEQLLAVYYIIACAEASSNLGRYDGIRYGHRASDCESAEELIIKSRSEGFGSEVKRRILLGTYVLSSGYYDEYYKKACAVREKLKEDFDSIFNTCNFVLTPTSPSVARPLGTEVTSPVENYLSDILTVPVNIAGLPAINLPVKGEGALPAGLQLIGKRFGESELMSAAYFFEQNCLLSLSGGEYSV